MCKNELFLKDKKFSEISSEKFVAILSKNLPAVFKIALSLINNGFTIIPLNPLLTGKQISRHLSAVNCNKIISDENLPSDFKHDCQVFNTRDIHLISRSYRKLCEIRNIFNDISSRCNRKTSIVFTSGSTGMPKAVLHTLGNHYYSSLGSNINIKFDSSNKWLIVLPLHHVSGLSIIFRAAQSGGKIVVKEQGMEIHEALKTNEPTHISLVPHQLQLLLNSAKNINILRKMEAILIGGSSVPENIIEQSYEYGLNLFVSYGSTEMCSQITCTKSKDTLEHLKTSGCLLKYREIKIKKNNNIFVKGKTLFAGYVIKEKSDNRLFLKSGLDQEGYFDTGDNGFMDNDGYLHITGRRDISFKYKAEKIYPEEIEKVFLSFKGVYEAIIVPYKKNDLENVPAVFLKLDTQSQKNLKNIREKIKGEMEPYKFPAYFLKWPCAYSSLKPSRKELQKIAQAIIKNEIKDEILD